ncbi:hypothetical protein P175DRAFT_0501076 [Aspergillus ochraceoroseus IBT 24754]|uniref:Uncharacterized protein n=1 Tax=Aspergillus ochraceoroseus IBT 24754 TaxID=1392256 RepID=A0A2T5M110_9EURO|nr:uncharacterized protein P175DRAFT_0501076 [Aspergillus ochraceoroseus IBT 24754]PTU22218.1 hypothetical protein P175DRAFT_0501076 [Aspergillus ochraceoroseus IBT 24754]
MRRKKKKKIDLIYSVLRSSISDPDGIIGRLPFPFPFPSFIVSFHPFLVFISFPVSSIYWVYKGEGEWVLHRMDKE